MSLKGRLAMSRRVKVASGAAVAGFALLGSGLVASIAPAASAVETPAAPTVTKQSNTMEERSTERLRCRAPHCYGAITLAFGDTTAGLSNRSASKRAAFRNAAADCRRASRYPCRRIVWVRNGCVAIAVKVVGRRVDKYGYSGAYRSSGPAIRDAKRECKRVRPVGRPCLKTAYTCTPRRY